MAGGVNQRGVSRVARHRRLCSRVRRRRRRRRRASTKLYIHSVQLNDDDNDDDLATIRSLHGGSAVTIYIMKYIAATPTTRFVYFV